MVPAWLHFLSVAYLLFGWFCAAVLTADLLRRPQPMWIMNLVWPITALFGTIWILWQYFTYGRAASSSEARRAGRRQGVRSHKNMTPFPIAVGNGTLHCGSGCALGDVCAEWLVYAFPKVAVAFGWHSLFSDKMFPVWVLDYVFAFVFGIFFQYFSIVPMRGLSFSAGIAAAVKADALSLTAWQIGMYGFMAIAYFAIFRRGFGVRLEVGSFEFWFMMQIAMIVGFLTAYPANWWLIKHGLKEKM